MSPFGWLCTPSYSHTIKKDGTLPGVNTSVPVAHEPRRTEAPNTTNLRTGNWWSWNHIEITCVPTDTATTLILKARGTLTSCIWQGTGLCNVLVPKFLYNLYTTHKVCFPSLYNIMQYGISVKIMLSAISSRGIFWTWRHAVYSLTKLLNPLHPAHRGVHGRWRVKQTLYKMKSLPINQS